jgi:hypothetical protein
LKANFFEMQRTLSMQMSFPGTGIVMHNNVDLWRPNVTIVLSLLDGHDPGQWV